MSNRRMEEQQAAHPFPYVKATMCFSWLCTKCYEVNHYGYENWSVYSGTAECRKCEKAHTVLVPWSSYQKGVKNEKD